MHNADSAFSLIGNVDKKANNTLGIDLLGKWDSCLVLAQQRLSNTKLIKWLKENTGLNPFKLFSFNTSIGDTLDIKFQEFKVTSVYARYSPEYSSFILLMREQNENSVENDLVIDPHILPNGQNAVLWVSNKLMEKTGGKQLVAQAEVELTFRPRPMNADIPGYAIYNLHIEGLPDDQLAFIETMIKNEMQKLNGNEYKLTSYKLSDNRLGNYLPTLVDFSFVLNESNPDKSPFLLCCAMDEEGPKVENRLVFMHEILPDDLPVRGATALWIAQGLSLTHSSSANWTPQ